MRKHTTIVRFQIPRCPYRMRHWFTYRGAVGSVSPTCSHCGAPNPYVTDEEIEHAWDDAERSWWASACARMALTPARRTSEATPAATVPSTGPAPEGE